jgi:hypothetical protein
VDEIYLSLPPELNEKEFARELSKKKSIPWKALLFSMKNLKIRNFRGVLSNYQALTHNQLEKHLKLEKKTGPKRFKHTHS